MQLGSMGAPKKVDVNGTPVFICCEDCRESLLEEPDKYLAKVAAKPKDADSDESGFEMDLPPIGTPEIIDPSEPLEDLPPIEAPQLILEDEPEEKPSRAVERVVGRREGGLQ